jgi:hypothetical protein
MRAVITRTGYWPCLCLARAAAWAALTALAACATAPVARHDFDPAANFSGYRTFAWVSDNPLILPDGRSPEISALNLQRIVTAIENELAGKGYRKTADGESADFAVAFTVGTREKVNFESYPLAWRGRWYWQSGYWDYAVRARTYTEGVLAIDIFDGRSRAPAWHGWTSRRITERERSDPATAIREAVAAILAPFPP